MQMGQLWEVRGRLVYKERSEQRLEGTEENHQASVWERVCQVEGTGSAKALKLELPGVFQKSRG